MTWRGDLRAILRRVRRKVEKIERGYRGHSWKQEPVSSIYLGSLVIELDNLVVDALRDFALTTIRAEQTRGLAIRVIGRRPIHDEEYGSLAYEALRPVAFKNKKPLTVPRRDEPTVRDPVQIKAIMAIAGLPKQTNFDNAIALNYGVFRQLKIPRHYYAHRNKDTFSELSGIFGNARLGPRRNPDEILHFKPAAAREPQLLEWTAEVRTFFETAIL